MVRGIFQAGGERSLVLQRHPGFDGGGEGSLKASNIAADQIEGAKIWVCHGVGAMFIASGTIIMSNEAP